MPETDGIQSQSPKPASDTFQANFERGMALHQQGRLADAGRIYEEVLREKPNQFDALHLLGVIALQTGHPERAIELIGKAIALKPDYADAHYNRGLALQDLKRSDDALTSYDRAIALKPDYAEAHNNHGLALQDLKRSGEALASYDRAIALKPDCVEAHNNRGVTLRDLKRSDEALANYDRAIALKPDYAEAYWNQSLCLLLLGRFEQGWRLYEWRRRLHERVAAHSFPQPLWLGEEDIAGKTLFLWWEQGFGDTIQFCRYAKLVEARGAKVIMSVQMPLRGLLKQISPTIQIINPHELPTDFDYHCPMLSLPLAFQTTLETIPAQQQYLKADEELRFAWSARLPPKTNSRIGLVWSGRTDSKSDYNRSMQLQQFLPILSADADWICLQKEIKEKDLGVLRQDGRIAYFGDELRDFSDTAALLDQMDLVITIDTSVAHLAGAMGKPVWVLLHYNSDWRWLLDRDDSPWYPSARLFRQQQIGDWAGVIDRVGSELRSVIG